MSGARRSGRVGTLAAAAVQIGALISGAATSLIVARELGPGGTGTYAVAGQFVLTVMMVGGLGLRTGVAYELAARRLSPRAAATEATVASLLFGTAAGAGGFLLYRLGSDSVFDGISEPFAIVLSASVPFAVAWWVLGAIPLAQERYEAFAVLQGGASIMLILTVIPLTLAAGIEGTLIAVAGALVAAGLIAIAWALRTTASSPRGGWELGESLRIGLRGWPLEMLQFLQLRPDVLIVAGFGSTADAGVYSLAVTVTTIGWVMPQAMGTVALPRVSAAAAEPALAGGEPAEIPQALAARALRHGVLLAIGAGVLVAALLLLAPVIFGEGFERTVELGLVMLPGVIALALGRVMIALLLGFGRSGSVLAIGASVVPAALVAYLLAVPAEGPAAAAIVSCIAYLLTTLGAALALRRSSLGLSASALVPRREDVSEYTGAPRRLLRWLRGEGSPGTAG